MDKEYIIQRMRRFCGYLAGFVFYISGILKLLDPVGAGLVMDEYFNFLHMGFLDFASKGVGIAFAFAETLIGAALITGVWRKVTAIASFAFQGFFTLLTLVLVIFNPQMDCGCFGEAVHLTHWQTFLKNIALCLLLAGDFIPLRNLGEPRKRKYVSFSIVTLSTILFTIYSLIYNPMVDFTEYKAAGLLAAAEGPEDAESPYKAVFTYEKDGVRQTFDIDHLPDSTWTFISTETIANEDYEENTISLSFYDADGQYQDRMAAEDKVMVISVYDPDIKQTRWDRIEEFAAEAEAAGFQAIIITTEDAKDRKDLLFSDYKTLITLNRSNGGATFFSDGYLIRKWAFRSLPDREKLEELHATSETETLLERDSHGSLTFQSFLLYVFAVMLLL